MKDIDKTDEEIVLLVQDGDIESFRILMERYEQKLSRYARRFLFDGDEAKDLLQEIFIKAYTNIKSFDASRRFSPWIYRIAHNEFINAIKKRTKEGRKFSLFDVDILFPHPIAKETANAQVDRKETRAMLDAYLTEIAPQYREILSLYYFEEMEYDEIAEILRVPISTVGVRLKRGKAVLRKIMEQKQ